MLILCSCIYHSLGCILVLSTEVICTTIYYIKEFIMNKQSLIVLFAVTSCLSVPIQARYILIDDPFSGSWIDSIMASHQRMMDGFASRFESFGPSKEVNEAFKKAREDLSKITHEIKEDDSSVAITFKGFTGLSKDEVKVVKKDTGWLGTITLKDGRIEFFISPVEFQLTSRIELKKEEKADKKVQDAKQQDRTFYTSQSATLAEVFSTAVEVSTLKGEVQPTEFKLTVQKQKEEVLPLS